MITRIITGIVGIPLAFYVINFGDWLFSLVSMLLAMLAWREFSQAFIKKGIRTSYALGLLAIFGLMGCAWLGNGSESMAVLTIVTLLVLTKAVLQHNRFSIEQACISQAGIFYIGLAFSHLILLRFTGEHIMVASPLGELPLGCALLWLAVIGTWSSDTFAYFTGSFFGKHKLCPDISPKKTVEGFLGGLAGTVSVTAVLGTLFGFSLLHMIVLGGLIALAATVGDLAESLFKRYTGIKDSGSLIPGHGGVWDRFDSIMFTVPLVYYYVQIFNILG